MCFPLVRPAAATTPSTEITEYIQGLPLARERGIHSNWSTNEKTAMDEALGMSLAGKRALVCMKHVGMNVAADAFVNSAMTGANGGLTVIANAPNPAGQAILGKYFKGINPLWLFAWAAFPTAIVFIFFPCFGDVYKRQG